MSSWREKQTQKFSTRPFWEMMDLFCILIVVTVTHLYAFSKPKGVYSNSTMFQLCYMYILSVN